jgi:hypothetical protein
VPDTRRHTWTRAQTARLSMLTHLSPTFGLGMGRLDWPCLFASGHWVAIYPFFCPHRPVRTWGGHLRRPAGDALRHGGKTTQIMAKRKCLYASCSR